MTIERHETHDEAETEAVGAALAATLHGGAVVALRGDLGAGKTRFVRGLARGLGLDPDAVSSPTFVLVHVHEPAAGASPQRPRLVHVDAYRLDGADDVESIGLDEWLGAPDAIVAIEWPDRLGAALPPGAIAVELAHVGATTRSIAIARP